MKREYDETKVEKMRAKRKMVAVDVDTHAKLARHTKREKKRRAVKQFSMGEAVGALLEGGAK